MSSHLAPLLVSVQLTPEQRALIFEQTGLELGILPFETDADVVRCRFGGIILRVTRGVFAPTPATGRLLDLVREEAAGYRRPVVVDVGTGCGALALALSAAMPRTQVVATDTSADAVTCARRNRDRLRLRNVSVRRGSLLAPVPSRLRGRVAVIAGNLPYIPPEFSDAALRMFPEKTAVGLGSDGLDLVRQLASAARDWLVPGGLLVLQMAGFQWPSFTSELVGLGYDEPVLSDDQASRPVAGQARWPGQAKPQRSK